MVAGFWRYGGNAHNPINTQLPALFIQAVSYYIINTQHGSSTNNFCSVNLFNVYSDRG